MFNRFGYAKDFAPLYKYTVAIAEAGYKRCSDERDKGDVRE